MLKKFCVLLYKQAFPDRIKFFKTGPEENCDFLEIIVRFNEHRKQTCTHRTTGCFDDRLLTMVTDTGFYVL